MPESFVERQPLQGRTLRASIELEAGNEESAREPALLAFDSSSRAANKQELSVLARLLARLHESEKALPLFEQASTAGELDDDCKRLINVRNNSIVTTSCCRLVQNSARPINKTASHAS